MILEPIIQIEDSLDRLDHTRKCITEYLIIKQPCQCGLDEIKAALDKYSKNQWEERFNANQLIR